MLNNSLDFGIKEFEFWDMTIAEIERAIDSKQRVEKVEAKEKAHFDYILASLIGRAMAAAMDSKNEYPDIKEVYPTLFQEEAIIKKQEEKEEKMSQLSAIRFKQFAQHYNKKYKGGGKDK